MIHVDVIGNLGNQMFEYACARALQERTGQKICLNISDLKGNAYGFPLSDFKLSSNVVVESQQGLADKRIWLMFALSSWCPKFLYCSLKRWGAYAWMGEPYVELPQKTHKDYYMIGYWQSARYFREIDDAICREFEPKYPLKPENREMYDKICNTQSVCVTIRRGDYVSVEKFKKMFFVCDNAFFLEGVRRIREEIPDATLFIFSDDIDWVRENVPFEGKVYYESGQDPVWEKLRLMAACKHFVISNSTFSWWAQHLSRNPDKIVYAPSRWYADGRKCDIYEENWRYIDV